MSEYIFNQVTGGYRWNMLHRIEEGVGLPATNTYDTILDGSWKTIINFSRDLNTTEQNSLYAIMANNPTSPPTPSGTYFKIDDIYNKLAAFNASAGVNLRIYFSQSLPPTGEIDTIELHADSVLSNPQKNQIKNAFANLIREA